MLLLLLLLNGLGDGMLDDYIVLCIVCLAIAGFECCCGGGDTHFTRPKVGVVVNNSERLYG